MTTDVFTNIVAPASVVVHLRELSRRLGKVDLDGMLVRGLSATGLAPATHYISSGFIRPAYLNAFTSPTRLFNVAKKAWNDDGEVFPFSQAQVTNKLALCIVTDGTFEGQPEDGHQMIVRLNLKLINESS